MSQGFRVLGLDIFKNKEGGREGGRESLAYEERQLGGAFSVLLVLWFFAAGGNSVSV